MDDYQQAFIEFALAHQVLRFGEFTLKSGRVSPYFFNAGLFNQGRALAQLGQFYAKSLMSHDVAFDALFGPAYKGIPLVSATAIALSEQHGRALPYAFNRKEAKDHGEGGQLVGADLAGQRIVLIDDVITAGTAVNDVLPLLTKAKAKLAAILIALDRQEVAQDGQSATHRLQTTLKVPVISIINMTQLIDYLRLYGDEHYRQYLPAMQAYGEQYGA